MKNVQIFVVLIFVLVVAAFLPTRAGAAIPSEERNALIALYNSTNGAGWTSSTNWLNVSGTDFNDPGTECDWYGVGCDADETTVIGLTLINKGLSGPLPPELGDLQSLVEIDFESNNLSGSIPPELGSLGSLRQFHAPFNELSGSIPPELGNLAALQVLELNNNQLTGVLPPELGNLGELGALILSTNQLSGSIPPEIGNMVSLGSLYLYNNRLSGALPAVLGSMHLNYLTLRGNQLVGEIPPEIVGLWSLWDGWGLDLRWNGLYSFDPAVVAFLDSKHDPDGWQDTQTVVPTDFAVGQVNDTSVELLWTPILYTDDQGGYDVQTSELPGGPYSSAGRTVDKMSSSLTVHGLNPSTTYHFKVTTITDTHVLNQSILTSESTPTLLGATVNGVEPQLSIGDSSVLEGIAGTSVASLTVSLYTMAVGVVTGDWSTVDGSAVAGQDYIEGTGTFSISPGESSTTVEVLVTGDVENESNEVFRVSLTNIVGASFVRDSARCIIVSDDYLPLPVFGDGFESGDTSAWSGALP